MKKLFFLKLSKGLLFLIASVFISLNISFAAPIIIDHTSVDRYATLSDSDIGLIQSSINWHYAHTSHGGQLTTGLTRLENADSRFNVSIGNTYLPTNSGTLNIFNGQESDTYVEPHEYWSAPGGVTSTQNVLNNNPTINLSGWSWCTQPNYYSTSNIQAYLDQMALFELANPDVRFIYMTGNAQATGSSGARRYANNELIRDWVKNSDNRILFDFADLDAWRFNGSAWEQNTYDYNGDDIPVEHLLFNGNQAGHTTNESCEQKGKAVWVMMADIAGVSAVPVPSAFYMFGIGLMGLAGLKRKYKS